MFKKIQGTKEDKEKLRYDLLSPTSLEGLVKILTQGEKDYGERNWEKGIKWGKIFGAMMRHAWKMWSGEDIDKKSGLPHIDHIQANAHFLSHYRIHNKEFDNRPILNKIRIKNERNNRNFERNRRLENNGKCISTVAKNW